MKKIINPKISILIPTCNRSEFLERAIRSALNQKYKNLEVIVSDNASIDNTFFVCQKFVEDERFRYYKNNINVGLVLNFKKLLYELCSGDWMIILSDDDCLIDENYLIKAFELVKKNDEIIMIYANGYLNDIDQGIQTVLELPYEEIENGEKIFFDFLGYGTKVKPQEFTLCNVIFNVQLAKEMNAFSNKYNVCCDSELFLKSCLFGKVGVIKDLVSIYQLHSGNSLKSKISYDDFLGRFDIFFEPCKLFLQMSLSAEKKQIIKRKISSLIREAIITAELNYRGNKLKTIIFLYNKAGLVLMSHSVVNLCFILKYILAQNAKIYQCFKKIYFKLKR